MLNIDDTSIVTEFGEWLRQTRTVQQKTQQEIAGKLGISQTYYSSIELGIKTVPFPLALRLCAALGLDFNDFVKRYI